MPRHLSFLLKIKIAIFYISLSLSLFLSLSLSLFLSLSLSLFHSLFITLFISLYLSLSLSISLYLSLSLFLYLSLSLTGEEGVRHHCKRCGESSKQKVRACWISTRSSFIHSVSQHAWLLLLLFELFTNILM